jgi:peptidoglycan/LPS O-acetylase OafA/YrhL
LARICRVFPLYFLLIFLSIFISSYIDPDFYYNFYSYGQIIKSLLFIRAPYVFWTIPVEVQFYFVFILFWFFYTKGTKYSLLFVLVIFIILPCYIYFYKDIQLPKSIASYSLAFFIGSVTSLFYTNIQGSDFLKKYSSHITLSVFLLICINLPGLRNAFIFDFSDGIYARTWGDPITCILVYCLFICVLLNNKYLNFLESKPFIMLGNISYGFYLMHYPIIIYVKSFTLFLPLKFIVAFLITATLAYLSNRYFERYAAREIRRIL